MMAAALLKSPGPYEANTQSIIEMARIIFPAPSTNDFVFSITVIPTFLKRGNL